MRPILIKHLLKYKTTGNNLLFNRKTVYLLPNYSNGSLVLSDFGNNHHEGIK